MTKKKKTYWQILLKADRQIWARSFPVRKECFANAKVIGNYGMDKWICAKCRDLFALSEVQCDHIVPIGNTIPQTQDEYEMLNGLLHCPLDGLQIMCKKCHKEKTKQDRQAKRKIE